MKKQYKSSIIKNHIITKSIFFFFNGIPLTHSHTITPFDTPGKQAF